MKAHVFELIVVCSNNIAICCLKLHEYNESLIFASNAVTLIESLQRKIAEGKSEVWSHLVDTRGMSMEKLLDMKKKAHNAVGKAELGRKNYKEAVDGFTAVLSTIEKITSLANVDASKYAPNVAETNKFLAQARQLLHKEASKEKSTWAKAFKENATLKEDVVGSPVKLKPASGDGKGDADDDGEGDEDDEEEKDSWASYWTGAAIFGLVGVTAIAGAAFLLSRGRRGR